MKLFKFLHLSSSMLKETEDPYDCFAANFRSCCHLRSVRGSGGWGMRPEPEFLNIQWRLKSRLFKESCLFKGQSVQQGLQWATTFLLLLKTILCKQPSITLNLAKMIYICILYLKYLETYLETLQSHFQPSCHFKMFKNSGSAFASSQWLFQQIIFFYTQNENNLDSKRDIPYSC